jgi:hypothetical protein
MPPEATNFSRFSIYDFRSLCEIAGINPDGHRRESNRRRREQSLRLEAGQCALNTDAFLERQAGMSSTIMLPSK